MKRFTTRKSVFAVFALLAVSCLLLSVLYGCGGSASLTGRSAHTAAKGGIPGPPGGGGGGGGTPPTGEAIVFTSSLEIKTINPDGTGAFKVTRRGHRPSWSPDGSQIVFSWVSGKQKEQSFDLFIINADGSGLTQLTNTLDCNERDPDWSPTEEKIVFSRDYRDLYNDRDIWVIKADGTGEPQNLTSSPGMNEGYAAWSADGAQIAWSRFDLDARTSNIWAMHADGTNPVQLTDDPIGNNCFPAWSPDGAHIAFVSTRDGDYEVYLLDVAKAAAGAWGEEVNLTNDPAYDRYPAWSPEGSKIVFSSARGERERRWGYVMNADGSDVQLIYDDSFDSPDWRAAP